MNITIGLFCLVNRSYDNPQSINQGLTWKSPAIITANRGWAATAQLIVMNVPLALLLVTSGFRSLWGCKKIPNHGRQDKKNEPYDNMVVPAILCVYNYVCIYTYIYIYTNKSCHFLHVFSIFLAPKAAMAFALLPWWSRGFPRGDFAPSSPWPTPAAGPPAAPSMAILFGDFSAKKNWNQIISHVNM